MWSWELCLYVETRNGVESMIGDFDKYIWLQRGRLRYSKKCRNNLLYESEARHEALRKKIRGLA